MTMKQYIFVLVLGLIAPVMLNAQINRVISLEYNENDFDIVEIENRVALWSEKRELNAFWLF